MVSLKAVQASNAALRSTTSGQVSLFVGATSGIAFHTLTEYARNANRPKVYIVGRNEATLSKVIADLKKINPEGTFLPIKSEISLLKNVDAACDELKSKEKSLDLLLMCPGYLKLSRQGSLHHHLANSTLSAEIRPTKASYRVSIADSIPHHTDNADGLEDTISLRYYVRARFIANLLPLLSSPQTSRIVSIHGAGKEGKMDENDLELARSFSMQSAAVHTSTMNTLALAEIASTHPSISCVHVFPGVVVTKAFTVFAADWVLPLRWFFVHAVLPFAKLFTVSLPESGQRHLFHATSARYPPAEVKDSPAAGVVLQKGMVVAKGEDGLQGSGCYLLNYDGETIGDQKLLDEYRKRGMGKKIWAHTQEVFDRVLSKA